MVHLATIIANYYRKHELLPDDTISCLEYTLKALLNELSKVLIYCCFFAFFKLLDAFLLSYLAFVSIRLFAGGVHCKTYWGCFFLSFLFMGGCVVSPLIFQIDHMVLCLTAIVSCVFPLLLSPMTPTFRVIKDGKKRVLLKVLAVVVSVAWIVTTCFMPYRDEIVSTILWTVSVANYQLIVPKVVSYIKRR